LSNDPPRTLLKTHKTHKGILQGHHKVTTKTHEGPLLYATEVLQRFRSVLVQK